VTCGWQSSRETRDLVRPLRPGVNGAILTGGLTCFGVDGMRSHRSGRVWSDRPCGRTGRGSPERGR